MGVGTVHRAIDPVGVKGRNGTAIATDANPLPVGPIPSQNGVEAGSGPVTAKTQRVHLSDENVTALVNATSNLGKAEDSPHASGDLGIPALAVRIDDPVAAPDQTSANGDYGLKAVDSKGRAWGRTFIVHDDGTIIKAKGQQASASSFPTVLSSEQQAILQAAADSLAVLDDWDSNDRAKASLIVGQDGVDGGAGASTAKTLRTQLADDSISAIRGASAKTLTDIWSTLQGQREISESLWTDDAGGYYLRRIVIDESVNPPTFTVSWTDKDGAASAGPGAGARPVSSLDRELVEQRFIATAGGTGYSVGDYLARVLVIDASQSPPAVDAAIWVNLSTGASISAPTAGTFEESGETVGVKGKDGTSLHGAANPVATEDQVAKDWDESDRAKVNPIVGQSGVEGGSGAVTAKTQRVTLATDVSLPPAGTAATSLGKAEDAASASGDTGIAVWGTRNDTEAARTSADGDYGGLALDGAGRVKGLPGQFTWTVADGVSVTSASATVVAAGGGTSVRLVAMLVDPDAVAGIHFNIGGTATTAKWKLKPGKGIILNTNQAVNAIREAAAVADVTVYYMTGVPV